MGKNVLSAAFLEEIRALLNEEMLRLDRELAHFAHSDSTTANENASETSADEGEGAELSAKLGDDLSLAEELRKAIKDVEGALKALDSGEYGVCKYCKQPIDEARLRIRPTSTSCVACKRTLTQEM